MHRGRGRVSRSTPAQRGANVSPRPDVDARQRPQRQLRPPARYAEVVPQAPQQRSCSARHRSREELQQATDNFIRNMRVEHERQCGQQQRREVGEEENDIEDMEVVEGTGNEQGEEQDETMENRREGQENVNTEHSQPNEEELTGNFITVTTANAPTTATTSTADATATKTDGVTAGNSAQPIYYYHNRKSRKITSWCL